MVLLLGCVACGSDAPTRDNAPAEPSTAEAAVLAAVDVRANGCGPNVDLGAGSLIDEGLVVTVAHVVAGMDATAGSGRFAIVVGDSLGFGLSRMYEAFRGMEESASRQIMIFQRMEEALAWLDQTQAN